MTTIGTLIGTKNEFLHPYAITPDLFSLILGYSYIERVFKYVAILRHRIEAASKKP